MIENILTREKRESTGNLGGSHLAESPTAPDKSTPFPGGLHRSPVTLDAVPQEVKHVSELLGDVLTKYGFAGGADDET